MAQVTWAFFRNAVPPRSGLMLRQDYETAWTAEWWGDCSGEERDGLGGPGLGSQSEMDGAQCGDAPCLCELKKSGAIFGVFLGDELLGQGVNVTELTLAATAVKTSWPGTMTSTSILTHRSSLAPPYAVTTVPYRVAYATLLRVSC